MIGSLPTADPAGKYFQHVNGWTGRCVWMIGVEARPVWGCLDCWSQWRRRTTRRRQTAPQRSACETKRPSDETETSARRNRRPRAPSPRNPSTQHRTAPPGRTTNGGVSARPRLLWRFWDRYFHENRPQTEMELNTNKSKQVKQRHSLYSKFRLSLSTRTYLLTGGGVFPQPLFPYSFSPVTPQAPFCYLPLPTASGFLSI